MVGAHRLHLRHDHGDIVVSAGLVRPRHHLAADLLAGRLGPQDFGDFPFVEHVRQAVAAQQIAVALPEVERPDVRRQRLVAAFPDHQISIESSTADGIEHVLRVHSDRDPGQFYLWNEYDGKVRHLLDPRPQVKAADMPRTQAVRFKARDGMELVGYLTLPKQKPAQKLPLIILPHGGPHGVRDSWGYDMEAAAFANAGYAVLKVNYRGSAGYGEKFRQLNVRNLGVGDAWDVLSGVEHLVKLGWVDPATLRTYCSDAAYTSSLVAGGAKL